MGARGLRCGASDFYVGQLLLAALRLFFCAIPKISYRPLFYSVLLFEVLQESG